jgi:hypothetical protein
VGLTANVSWTWDVHAWDDPVIPMLIVGEQMVVAVRHHQDQEMPCESARQTLSARQGEEPEKAR